MPTRWNWRDDTNNTTSNNVPKGHVPHLVQVGAGGDPHRLLPPAHIVVYDYCRHLSALAHARTVTDEEAKACKRAVLRHDTRSHCPCQEKGTTRPNAVCTADTVCTVTSPLSHVLLLAGG